MLDLGAGTGKLTSMLLDLGRSVVAVEPDPAMRHHLDARAQVLAGSAEDLPLEDGSVDAVLVGQAWHWFDPELAAAQCRRVLRAGGRLGLLWNVLDDRVPWVRELVELVGLEDRWSALETEPPPTVPSVGPWERREFAHQRPGDADLIVDDIRSRSIVILMAEAEREALLDEVRAVIPAGTTSTAFVCDTWRASV